MSESSSELSIRSSFAEREDAADRLTAAQGEGRISADELFERLHRITDSSTRAQLASLVADLPSDSAQSGSSMMGVAPEIASGVAPDTHLALLGGYSRSGRWTVPAELRVFTLIGGISFDLSEAIFTSPVTSILLVSGIGGVNLKVPRGVRVQVDGLRLLGGRNESGAPEDFDGRTIRVSSWGVLGGVSIRRV